MGRRRGKDALIELAGLPDKDCALSLKKQGHFGRDEVLGNHR
jgi:hypothetical protein